MTQKGTKMDEKNICRLRSQICSRIGWKDWKFCADSKNMHINIFSDIWCHRMTSSVIRCHVMSYNDIWCHKVQWYICFWNQHWISDRLTLFWNKSENIVEKLFFHPRVPPFVFYPFLGHFERFVPGYFGCTRILFEARDF